MIERIRVDEVRTAMASEALVSERFAQFRRAEAAIDRLCSHPVLVSQPLELVEPVNSENGRDQSPYRAGDSLLRRHLLLVALGLAMGLAACPFLFVDLSRGDALVVTAFFGVFLGLLLCAASSPRRRRSGVPAAGCGWTVIVHCRDSLQTGLARRILTEEAES